MSVSELHVGYRVVLTLTDTKLLQPSFVDDLIRNMPAGDAIVGIVLLPVRSRRYSTLQVVQRFVSAIGAYAVFVLMLKSLFIAALDVFDRLWGLERPVTVRGVARRHRIPVFATDDINGPACLAWLHTVEPDVIVNSSHAIFGRSALATPRIACLNRHCSLLPAYRGVFPVFWAMLHDALETGVSVHVMSEGIDTGRVLSATKVSITSDDTHFGLLQKCFAVSADTVISALDRLRTRSPRPAADRVYAPVVTGGRYFSYPTRRDARRFYAKGLRFI